MSLIGEPKPLEFWQKGVTVRESRAAERRGARRRRRGDALGREAELKIRPLIRSWPTSTATTRSSCGRAMVLSRQSTTRRIRNRRNAPSWRDRGRSAFHFPVNGIRLSRSGSRCSCLIASSRSASISSRRAAMVSTAACSAASRSRNRASACSGVGMRPSSERDGRRGGDGLAVAGVAVGEASPRRVPDVPRPPGGRRFDLCPRRSTPSGEGAKGAMRRRHSSPGANSVSFVPRCDV